MISKLKYYCENNIDSALSKINICIKSEES